MYWILIIFLCLLLNGKDFLKLLRFLAGKKESFGSVQQEWGYVEVRASAKIFWWLYYVVPRTGKRVNVYEKPLVIWLQGGPGTSSTGVGNFVELGPLDVNGNPRDHTWIKDYNVLFIDSPVGSGFSYVEIDSAFAKTNRQIGEDLLQCMREFLKKFPGFRNVKTYVIGESYGGKMAAEFALLWYKAQTEGNIASNLKGIALGNSWISPIDSIMSWAPYLLFTGIIDDIGYKIIKKSALQTKKAIKKENWLKAYELFEKTVAEVKSVTDNIDIYHILEKNSPEKYDFLFRDLRFLLNRNVKQALGLNSTWGAQEKEVYRNLHADIMKSVIDIVEQLKDQTDLEIFVYTGQLDSIVSTAGTLKWIERMFKNVAEWQQATRFTLIVDNIVEGYFKEYENFKIYWVNRAGHMVPRDNPQATTMMLQHLTKGERTLFN